MTMQSQANYVQKQQTKLIFVVLIFSHNLIVLIVLLNFSGINGVTLVILRISVVLIVIIIIVLIYLNMVSKPVRWNKCSNQIFRPFSRKYLSNVGNLQVRFWHLHKHLLNIFWSSVVRWWPQAREGKWSNMVRDRERFMMTWEMTRAGTRER